MQQTRMLDTDRAKSHELSMAAHVQNIYASQNERIYHYSPSHEPTALSSYPSHDSNGPQVVALERILYGDAYRSR